MCFLLGGEPGFSSPLPAFSRVTELGEFMDSSFVESFFLPEAFNTFDQDGSGTIDTQDSAGCKAVLLSQEWCHPPRELKNRSQTRAVWDWHIYPHSGGFRGPLTNGIYSIHGVSER